MFIRRQQGGYEDGHKVLGASVFINIKEFCVEIGSFYKTVRFLNFNIDFTMMQ